MFFIYLSFTYNQFTKICGLIPTVVFIAKKKCSPLIKRKISTFAVGSLHKKKILAQISSKMPQFRVFATKLSGFAKYLDQKYLKIAFNNPKVFPTHFANKQILLKCQVTLKIPNIGNYVYECLITVAHYSTSSLNVSQ